MAVRRSLIFSLTQRYLTMAIGLGSTVILARLLTPEEMGVFFVAAAIMLAVQTVAQFGVLHYVVQERRLTRARFRAAVGVIVVSSLVGFAVLWAARWPIAEFYQEPGLVDVMTIHAFSLLVIPLNTPAVAWLQREMRFDAVFVIGLAGAIVQAITAIWLVLAGYSFMALAWAALAEQAGITAATLLFRSRETWVLPSLRGWRKVVRVGASMSAAQLVQEMGNLAPQLAIGRLQGFDGAGLFNRGLTAVNLFHRSFVMAIVPVLLPAFSRTHREGGDMREALMQAVAYIAVIAWPFFAVTAIMAFPIVRLLFGDQWDAAVPVVQILALTGLCLPINSISGEVLVALGRSGAYFRIQSSVQIVRIFAAVSLAAVSIVAVAAAMAGATLIQLVLVLRTLKDATGLSVAHMGLRLRSSVLVTALAVVGPLLLTLADPEMTLGLLPTIAIGGGTAALGWIVGVIVGQHPAAGEVRGLLDHLRRHLPRAPRPAPACAVNDRAAEEPAGLTRKGAADRPVPSSVAPVSRSA